MILNQSGRHNVEKVYTIFDRARNYQNRTERIIRTTYFTDQNLEENKLVKRKTA
jgi:hypothetical protein